MGLILCFLKDRMPCSSTFLEDPACQQQAKDKKNYSNGVLIKKSLLEKDLKLKGIIYFVFSREVKTTNQPEEKKNYRKVANNNGQLLGKRARYISHSSPIKIQKRKNCFE